MTEYRYAELTFVSGNADKYREYRALLGISDLRWSRREIAESQHVGVDTLVNEKVRALAREMPGTPFFVEHTGLVIEAWRNLPGGLIRVFLDNVGNEGICRMMRDYTDRAATAVVWIGFRAPDGRERLFRGQAHGRIADEPVGQSNFGWDPIFIPAGQPDGAARTYAQMPLEEKNRTSMRAAAAADFASYISGFFVL
jgi:non-canonical purine NTP pyrophosphatase (RdgB/HAM1 family)